METINYYPSDTTIDSLLFSNYISEEIRCLSVKEFTSSQAIDRLGALVSDSPYDLALGPFDKKMIVVLLVIKGFVACPGHFRHISLVLRVYNPVLLDCCCLHCHTIQSSKANKKNKIEINDESIDNVDDQEEVLIKMMSRQMYLTPLDLLKHLEKISTNEREVLAISPVLPSKFCLNRSSSLINRLRGTTNEQKA
ncbi:unnamed protein product [Rotaria sordida]|uniref:DNA-directed RNA polymerase n=1 Tax=Rotaria sordida TaxID=392033 RepID=A0A815FPA8_9BILA|nr:unnamed protein product [Rotaria sordida]CAF3958717.1 unnamed protein product [Rotaria sordida]CAF3992586.1 unnamed protein product [Rotaria sordida]